MRKAGMLIPGSMLSNTVGPLRSHECSDTKSTACLKTASRIAAAAELIVNANGL
jgi:hypothetical protein